jgi:hypothetical protein
MRKAPARTLRLELFPELLKLIKLLKLSVGRL